MTGVTTEDAYASLYTESFVPKASDGNKQRPPAFLHSFRNFWITELRRDGAALRYFDAEFTSSPYVRSFF